jgi:hypothetical protein
MNGVFQKGKVCALQCTAGGCGGGADVPDGNPQEPKIHRNLMCNCCTALGIGRRRWLRRCVDGVERGMGGPVGLCLVSM